MKKALKITGIVILCLVGLLYGLLAARKDWVKPRPGVRLTPMRPILTRKDVKPGSAIDLLRRATDLPGDAACFLGFPTDLMTNVWSDAKYSDIVNMLSLCEANFVLAREAGIADNPQVVTAVRLGPPYGQDWHPYVEGMWTLANLLTISAIRKASHGEYDGAFEDIDTAIRSSDMLSRGGNLVNCGYHARCHGIALATVLRIVTSHEVPEKNLKEMLIALNGVESNLEPWAECIRYEYVLWTNSLSNIRSESSIWLGYGDSTKSIWRLAVHLSDSRETERSLERVYSHLVYCAEHPEDRDAARYTQTWEGKKDGFGIFVYSDPFGYLFLRPWRMIEIDIASTQHLTHLFMLSGTRAFLGVELFKKKNGKLPAKLEDLVPEYLDAVPVDPFDGKPLRYKVSADGKWMIYSVGANRTDDGGDIGPGGTRRMGVSDLDLVLSPDRFRVVPNVETGSQTAKEVRKE